MNYEQAFYLKLLMEVGISDDFDNMLDEMLEKENPLSDFTLSLLDCNGDRNKQLHVLNEYINTVPIEQIDTDSVFYMLVDKLKSMYEENPESIYEITQWMGTFASSSNMSFERPWFTMYIINDYYYLIREGEITEEYFINCFLQLLYQKKLINP